MTRSPDVNVLIALTWPDRVHRNAAKPRFASVLGDRTPAARVQGPWTWLAATLGVWPWANVAPGGGSGRCGAPAANCCGARATRSTNA